MAMSLEDLLSEEGFKRRKGKTKPRASFASEGTSSMPLYTQRDKHESGSLLAVRRTERTRSDIPRYDSRGEFSTSSSFTGRKPRDNLSRKIAENGTSVKYERRRDHRDSWDAKRFGTSSAQNWQGSEITEVVQSDEIVEVGMNRSYYKDIYSNKVNSQEESESKHSTKNEGRERHMSRDRRSFNDTDRRSMKQPQSSDNRLNKSGSNKVFDESLSIRQTKLEEALASPALDEAAVKAIISILSGHVKGYVKDEEFRTSLHHNTFASLNFIGLDEGLNTESKVIENLEQAIEIVERAAEESATLKELKRASLQLSVITGLNSNDLKHGFTSGVANFKLSACAHLYLSVIYMIQKKDGISAKHLLQVFCDSPYQARTTLLPNLWDHVFFPHLLHLKLWYDKETHSLADSPIFTNLKLLEKVYNESLDSGTYQFAMYYKDWITEVVEAPSVPLIKLPSLSVQLMPRGGLHGHTSSPASHVSPQPMVSKKLYDEVFRHSNKSGVDLEVHEEQNFHVSGRSSNSPAAEDKQLILYSHNSVTCSNQNFEHDGESPDDKLSVAEEAWRLHTESSSGVANLDENYGACQWYRGNSHYAYKLQAPQPIKGEKLSLENPEIPVFELKQIEESRNSSVPRSTLWFTTHPEDAEHCAELEAQLEPSIQEQQDNYEDFRGTPSLCIIPEDFLCPLTGLLFQDPVTLETGQNFEREAITDWFGKGCVSCPVTRKTLQCQAVPPTNLILKRVIDKWKTDHFKHLLALLSQVAADSSDNIEVNDNRTICIIRQLLSVFNKDERIINARRIMSFGGLQVLLRRFNCASTQEKSFILPLLSCCIEADAGCRNVIARNISQSNLLQILHCEQIKTRTNAVLLLMELICMNGRSRANSFLGGIRDEEIISAADHLLIYLQTCPLEQTPLVAVLLLHIDLLSRTHTSSIYRQEAVDALTIALERSLSDEKVEKKCCRALLILGGFFSSSGKLMTEDWILRVAGFLNGPDFDVADNEANDIAVDAAVLTMVDSVSEDGDEENAREKWLTSLSGSLVGDGKTSFLDSISKCVSLGRSDLVRVCLTTVAWLSFSLASLPNTEFQLCAFSALISPLKRCLEYGNLVEHKVLASLSLLNFSTIPECRVLLMQIGEEIGPSLENLAEVTWTAQDLYTIISGHTR